MAEGGIYAQWQAFARACVVGLVGKGHRHEGDVVHVAGSRTVEMGVGESRNRTVRVEIAGNAVPSADEVVWRKLHHAEGHLGSWIGVSCKVGADQRVDQPRIVNCGYGECASGNERRKYA